jgi:hypothetical protein
MRRHLAQELPETHRETVDLGIKDRVRLLRLPNTIHEKSNFYKVMITADELRALNPEEIRELARTVRPLPMTDETGYLSHVSIGENPVAARFFRRIRRQVKSITRRPFSYRFRRPADLTHISFPCAGVQRIWESHIVPGNRNNCAIRLASQLRLLGLTDEEARGNLFEWNEKNAIDLPLHEIDSVIRSAYQHPFPYRYSCHDKVLRSHCPLGNLERCQAHVASRSEEGEK